MADLCSREALITAVPIRGKLVNHGPEWKPVEGRKSPRPNNLAIIILGPISRTPFFSPLSHKRSLGTFTVTAKLDSGEE